MAAWSAENATKAYLHTIMTSGRRSTLTNGGPAPEPDAAEFISALAAGTGARLIVEARSSPAGPTTLALLSAARQTPGARVVCILPDPSHLQEHPDGDCDPGLIEFVVGDARSLITNEFRGADFLLVDCELEGVFEEAALLVTGRGLVVGYNAFKHHWCDINKTMSTRGIMGTFLPIGDGLRVCRAAAAAAEKRQEQKITDNKKPSRWVKRVDECTGEEHVYRITGRRKSIQA